MNIETQGQGKDCQACVLLVDDDIRILRFTSMSLKVAGYNVITATNGEDALKLMESEKPRIMVLDILMSPMDGFEVLKRTRALSQMPVIAISAHTSAAEKALSLGANDFLAKPFRPDELTKKINVLLK